MFFCNHGKLVIPSFTEDHLSPYPTKARRWQGGVKGNKNPKHKLIFMKSRGCAHICPNVCNFSRDPFLVDNYHIWQSSSMSTFSLSNLATQ